MAKWNTHTPPPSRDPIITHSHAHASTSGEQITQGSYIVLVTPRQEQTTQSDIYILVSPILGPIPVEQLLKGNFHNVVKIRRWFAEEQPTQDPPQNDNQYSLSPGDQNTERRHKIFSEPSTPGFDLGSLYPDSATPWHSIRVGGTPPSPPSSSSSSE